MSRAERGSFNSVKVSAGVKMARSDVEPWIALDVDFRKMRELNGNGGAISSYFEKTQFTGEVVAVLAPSHGHAPLHRPQLPGALVRGSRAELPSLPRPQRSLWPHCDEIVRMTEVPLQMPGIERREHIVSPPRTRSPPRVHVLVQEDEDEDEEMHFDAEAALAAARRERSQRTDSAVRGRPLGRGGPGEPGGSGEPDGPGGPGAKALRCEGPEARSESEAEMKCSHAQRSRDSSREREAAQAAFSNLAHAEAMMLASLRPRTRVTPKIQLVARPPVVEIPRVERQPEGKPERTVDGRVERADRRESISRRGSLSPPRRKASERDLRAREKIGKLLVAHYEVSTRSEAKKQQMLMRVILANEEKNSEALTEGLALLQNAQNLIGGEKSTKSRVTLKALCLLDRKINVRSTIADSVRTLEELTRRKEKLLVDMVPAGKEEDVSASVGLHLEDADLRLADALKKSWEEVHREASSWAPEKAKESAAVKVFERLKHKKEAEREAALEQMRQALGIAVWRFAQAEAQKEDDLLGGESLQRAARIEYAIKAAEAQGVDPRHQSLSKALQIAFDLRALRAMRYCQHLMSSIEPDVLGSAGKVANLIDQVIQDASELYGVPKDHKHMEEARRLVLKARTEEAQAKRRAAQS